PGKNSHADEPYEVISGNIVTKNKQPNGGMRTPVRVDGNMTAFAYNNRAISGWGHTMYNSNNIKGLVTTLTGDSGWIEGTRPDESYDEWSCIGGSFDFGPKPGVRNRSDERLDMPPVTYYQTDSNYNYVLDRFGAFPRDNTDKRLENQVRTRTGQWKDSTSRNMDQNTYTGAAKTDTDGDGMPDEWETSHNLDPNSASDGIAKTLNSDGYTNFEVYVNELADNLVPPMPENPAVLSLGDYKINGKMINVEKGFAVAPPGYNPVREGVSINSGPGKNNYSEFLKLSTVPNPFGQNVCISLKSIPKKYISKKLSFTVYSISGNKIISHSIGYGNGLVWHWDAGDYNGKKIPDGVYFVNLTAAGKNVSKQRLLLVR
ncbi:MAG: hypothetical protein ABIA63_12140, partial [bacterium]